MAYAVFAPCPHCQVPLAYLEAASGSTAKPQCPSCHEVVPVVRATFLMRDRSWSGRRAVKEPGT
jgi:hypothetical protein